jgi:hypothetical protein
MKELVDKYQQTGTHNVNSSKLYKERIKEEWDRIRPVLDELNVVGKELEAFNTYLTLQFRLIKLIQGEQPANPSKSIGSEAPATTVHLLEISMAENCRINTNLSVNTRHEGTSKPRQTHFMPLRRLNMQIPRGLEKSTDDRQ